MNPLCERDHFLLAMNRPSKPSLEGTKSDKVQTKSSCVLGVVLSAQICIWTTCNEDLRQQPECHSRFLHPARHANVNTTSYRS